MVSWAAPFSANSGSVALKAFSTLPFTDTVHSSKGTALRLAAFRPAAA